MHELSGCRRRSWRLAVACAAAMLLALVPRAARAYTIETSVTRGCHEELTADALRATRKVLPQQTQALHSLKDDRALIDDVAFSVPGDLNDIGAVTLLLGVRDNDVKSFAALNIDELAALNASPGDQKEHCLRSAEQDEPGGSAAALLDCRDFVRTTLLSALDGLDGQWRPDGAKRDSLKVALAIRGQTDVHVPMFYLRAGRALHAIEDSFTHTFRKVGDGHKVSVVLNWIDFADSRLRPNVDGPAHLQELDRCDDADELRTERRHLAIEAASAALVAVLDPATDRAGKTKEIDALLDKYIAFDADSHCTVDNHWCDAPELAYAPGACGCAIPGSRPRNAPVLLGLLALGAMLALRRPRQRACKHAALLPAILFALALAPRTVRAEESAHHETGGPLNALAGHSKAGASGEQDGAGAFFGRLALGGSYDKPGVATGVGLRYQVSHPFMVGFDTEWNPWIATSPTRLRAGALNTYFSLIRRFQLKVDTVNIRTTVALGASFLFSNLVGAPAGSVGPFMGLSFLGVEWKVAPGYYLTIDPTYIALPIPHLTGAPFGYLQYRFQLGLEFGG